ncbi:hypothetical protein OAB57_02720 [Bacteriovoracaceae bacterium]|nr:hypothetical protein [Bacteriovoracaceae bacterium]
MFKIIFTTFFILLNTQQVFSSIGCTINEMSRRFKGIVNPSEEYENNRRHQQSFNNTNQIDSRKDYYNKEISSNTNYEQPEYITSILCRSKKLNLDNRHFSKIFKKAIKQRHTVLAKLLAAKMRFNPAIQYTAPNSSPFHMAVRFGDLGILKVLERNAKKNGNNLVSSREERKSLLMVALLEHQKLSLMEKRNIRSIKKLKNIIKYLANKKNHEESDLIEVREFLKIHDFKDLRYIESKLPKAKSNLIVVEKDSNFFEMISNDQFEYGIVEKRNCND